MEKYFVIDVGGTETKYGVLDEEANIIKKGVTKTKKEEGLEGFLDFIKELYEREGKGTQGIAISMPGVIDEENGYCHTGGFLIFNQKQPIAKLLSDKCNTKVHINNDGKCVALAEYWKGALQGCSNGLVMVLGSGIGGGIIIDGKVLKGKHFFAGELSYINTNMKNYKSEEEMFGLGYSSVSMINKIKVVKNIDDPAFDGYKAFELINQGDEQALEVFHEVTKGLAIELYNLQVILDMEIVAIGGGISRQPILVKTIKKHWDEILEEMPYKKYSQYMPQAQIKPCEFTSDANLIGALYSYMQYYKQI